MVLRNKRAMFVWAVRIILSVAIGFATALIGLVLTMPLIGHATWHAYRETIDAAAWPAKPGAHAARRKAPRRAPLKVHSVRQRELLTLSK